MNLREKEKNQSDNKEIYFKNKIEKYQREIENLKNIIKMYAPYTQFPDD